MTPPLAQIESPGAAQRGRWLVLGFGFRPFFLAAATAAVFSMLAWLAALRGLLAADATWHAHEMTFGFATAVIAGFLLTAVPNWTGAPRIGRAGLAALVALWAAGRVCMWPPLAAWAGPAGAGVDLAFVPALALTVAVPILSTRNRRNYGIPLILLALGAAHALADTRVAPGWAAALGIVAPRAAVHAIVLLVVVIGGRVTPAFTRNALATPAVRETDARDVVAIASAALALALTALTTAPPALVATVCATAALANAARMHGWATLATRQQPLLWILHAGYAWVVAGLALTGVSAVRPDLVTPSAAVHAFTAGAIGAYVLGMMSRVALGHVGRALALPRLMLLAYAAILLAGGVRVAVAVFSPTSLALAWEIAGALWCVAFGTYGVVYFRILTSPRPDGRPG